MIPLLWQYYTQKAAAAGAYTLECEPGIFAIAGQDADLLCDRLLTCDAGELEITGQDAGLIADRVLACDAGSFLLTGQDAELLYSDGSGAIGVTFIDDAQDTNANTTYNFGDFVIPVDGLVVVAVNGRGGINRTVASISIGGSAGAVWVTTDETNNCAGIGGRAASAGTHNITVTFSDSMFRASIGVYVLTGYVSATPSDVHEATGSSDSASVPLDFPANGLGIYCVLTTSGTATFSWSEATEDYEAAFTSTAASAHKTDGPATPDTETITISSSNDYAVAAAVWQPAAATGYTLTADPVTLELAGQDAGLSVTRLLIADAADLEITGQAAALLVDRVLGVDAAELEVFGQDASLLVDRALSADTAELEVASQQVTLTVDYLLSCTPAMLEAIGQEVDLTYSGADVVLNVDPALIELTGQEASLLADRALPASHATIHASGQEAALLVGRTLSAQAAELVIAGQVASLLAGRQLAAAPASLELAGQAADLLMHRVLSCSAASLALTGQEVVLTSSAEIIRPEGGGSEVIAAAWIPGAWHAVHYLAGAKRAVAR